jgi:hypothetical protein
VPEEAVHITLGLPYMPALQLMLARALRVSHLAGVEGQGVLVSVGFIGAEAMHIVPPVGIKSHSYIEAAAGQLFMPPKVRLLASASGGVASPGLHRGAHVLRHSRVAWRPSKCGCGEGRGVLRPRHHRAWMKGLASRCTASCRSGFVAGANLTRRSSRPPPAAA